MRVLRALLIGLATLLAIALLAVWLAPRYLDWSRYRDQIARIAATALDRPVLIEGPITLSVLPRPELTAFGVGVAGNPDEGTFAARELSLRVALAPLLAGRLEARKLVLRGVDLHVPWPPAADALPVLRPNWLAGLSTLIEDGRVTVGTTVLTDIAASLTSAGPLGGYRLAGSARWAGRPWRFAAHLTSPGADGAAGLEASVEGEGPAQGLAAMFSGQVSPDGAGGRLSVRGPDFAQVLPAPEVPFSAEGRLRLVGGVAAVDDLALKIGDARGSGSISLRLSPSLRVDMVLGTSRIDFDAWLGALLKGDGFSVPVAVDLSAEAAELKGGLIRGLRAKLEISGGGIEVREAAATLPGEASLRLSGTITRLAPAEPRFAGKFALAAPDFGATLRWLDPPGLDALGPSVLRSLDVAGQAVAEPARLNLTELVGVVDASHVAGGLTVAFGGGRDGRRAALGADLRLDRLELDAWLPAALPSPVGLPLLPAGLDVDLRLRVARVLWRGTAISGFALNAAATGGRLDLRRLEGEVEGVRASLSGALDLDGRVTRGRLDLAAADATPLARLLPPEWWANNPGLWHAACRAEAEVDGLPGALGVRLRLALGEARLAMQSTLDLPARQGSGSIKLNHPGAARLLATLGLAGAGDWLGDGPLAVDADIAGAPDRIGADKIALTAGLLRAGGRLRLDLAGGPPRLSGHVAAAVLPLPFLDTRLPTPLPFAALSGWQGTAELTATVVLAGPAGAKRPVLQNASADATLADGMFRIDGLTAKLAGGTGTLRGTLNVNAASEPPSIAVATTLSGAVIAGPVSGLPLDIVAGQAEGSAKLAANGHSVAALLATLEGEVALTVRDGKLAGLDLGAVDAALGGSASGAALDASLRSALAGGATGFEKFEIAAKASGGVLALGNATLQGPGGKAAFSGSIDFPDRSLDLSVALAPALADAPRIAVRLTGPFDAPVSLPELADVTRWRAQRPAAP